LDKVSAEYQTNSGSVTLRVRTFSAEAAQRFASALMKYGEEKVNLLAERERRDRIEFARTEVRETEQRLVAARQALLKLQQEHGDINPLKSAEAAFSIKTGLESELAKTQAELSAAQAYLTPDAREVIELRAKARALSGQIVTENRKLVDPKKNHGVAEIFAAFETAAMEKEFAEKTYAGAVAALELARTDATRQHRYVVPLAEPSLADESTYPEPGMSIAGVGALSLLGMGILSLLVAAIREHSSI
jgi:capsular polysaccharide transport system permease protein